MLIKAIEGDRLGWVVVHTQSKLHPAEMVGGDLNDDRDHLTDFVAARDDAVGVLATCFVFARILVPRITTNTTSTLVQVVLHLQQNLQSSTFT